MSDELKDIYKKEGKLKYFFDDFSPCELFRAQKQSESKDPVLFPHPGFSRKNGPDRLPDVKVVDRDGKKFVLGCRCTSGDYRGVSTFDATVPALKGFVWFKLPKGVEIPPGLAITQDSDLSWKANHYTVAPKDDMSVEHFQMLLNTLAKHLKKL